MRRLLLLVLLASPLSAQYFDFAVTDDGRLYFSTPLATGEENSRFKVYRLAGERLDLFASGSRDSNPFGTTASAPLVSGDGSITGWALAYPCSSGSCGLAGLPRVFYQLQGAGIETLTANAVQISRNGRFLAAATFDGHVRLIELSSQRTTDLGQGVSLAGSQSVADTGAVLLRDSKSLLYRSPDGEIGAVAGAVSAQSGVLSPDGRLVAYERIRDDRLDLVLGASVLASAPRDLAAPWPNIYFRYQPSFANDGTLLYIDPDRQPVIVPPGGNARRLVPVDAGVQRAILSGDGRIAWLATYSGQLLRVHTDGLAIEEVVPATPYLAAANVFAFPGSVVRFGGSGVTRATSFHIGETTLPLSAFGDDVAYVQIPWEYPETATRSITVQAPGSPFLQRFDFTPLDRPAIWFEREGQALKAAHQDFRGLIDTADPARLGETLHVFARNMGPVDVPVATGARSPDPPARVTTPLACYLFELSADGVPSRPTGLVVPFAGLSPGLVGVYHIDVTIPRDWQSEQALLQCHMDSGDGFFHGDQARITVAATPD